MRATRRGHIRPTAPWHRLRTSDLLGEFGRQHVLVTQAVQDARAAGFPDSMFAAVENEVSLNDADFSEFVSGPWSSRAPSVLANMPFATMSLAASVGNIRGLGIAWLSLLFKRGTLVYQKTMMWIEKRSSVF